MATGRLVIGRGVVDWVNERLQTPYVEHSQGIGWGEPDRILMGAVFNCFTKQNINMHIAKLPEAPFSRTFVWAIMDYPFNQLKVKRITGTIAKRNLQSQRFARHLGAKLEGTMIDALPDDDLCIFGLLRSDAQKWLVSQHISSGVVYGRHPQTKQRAASGT